MNYPYNASRNPKNVRDRITLAKSAHELAERSEGNSMSARRLAFFWQLVRYAVNGAIATSIYTGVFVGLDSFTHARLQLCNMGGYVAAVLVGYILHSRVTFRDHGTRGRSSQARFVLATVPSLFLNGFWVWLLGTRAGLPHWTVQLPIWFVTPLLTFGVQRWWVFR